MEEPVYLTIDIYCMREVQTQALIRSMKFWENPRGLENHSIVGFGHVYFKGEKSGSPVLLSHRIYQLLIYYKIIRNLST